jgi:uncharacterized membrane protein YfcA
VLGAGWTEIIALAAAYVIAVVATPAGISGAVLLLPFQVSVLGTPSPAVTPTNLLYNVVATPGALYRYWRHGQTGGRLALVLIAGTLPGVIAGSVIRVELLPAPEVFDVVVAAVLVPLGVWLALTRPPRTGEPDRPARLIPAPVLVVLAVAVGCVGGIYGIGGGSILAPILIGSGRKPSEPSGISGSRSPRWLPAWLPLSEGLADRLARCRPSVSGRAYPQLARIVRALSAVAAIRKAARGA